jgi:hypothetical protein
LLKDLFHETAGLCILQHEWFYVMSDFIAVTLSTGWIITSSKNGADGIEPTERRYNLPRSPAA